MKKAPGSFHLRAALAATALFTACDGSVSFSIRASEILDIAKNTGSTRYVTASVVANNLDKEEDIAFLKATLRSPGEARKVKNGDAESYCFDVRIPIVSSPDDSGAREKALFTLLARGRDAAIDLVFRYDRGVIEEIQGYFSAKYQVRIDPADFTIRLGLVNDTSRRISISGRSVYVGEGAYPFDYTTELEADARIELVLSEVLTKAIVGDEEGLPILRLEK